MSEIYFKMNSDRLDTVVRLIQDAHPKATEDEIKAIVFADWENADEHQQWLDEAPIVDIANWAEWIWAEERQVSHIRLHTVAHGPESQGS